MVKFTMKIHEQFMKEALKQARRAFDLDEVPVGAVIVYKKKIIGRAHNQIKLLKDPTAHAEIIAITQAAAYLRNERLNTCDMYVTIEPCSMCAGAMVLARVRTLYYGAKDPKTGAAGSIYNILNTSKSNHRIKIEPGIMEDDARLLMKEFFRKKRKNARSKVTF